MKVKRKVGIAVLLFYRSESVLVPLCVDEECV